MKIALLSFDFIESSLPLAKHLSKENDVSYFVFTSYRRKNQPGLDLNRHKLKPGLNKIDIRKCKELYEYVKDTNIKIYAINYLPNLFLTKKLNERIQEGAIDYINNQKYDIVNIIGQTNELVYYHKKIVATTIHTFHEIYNHIENRKLSSYLLDYIIKENVNIILHSEFIVKKFKEYYPNSTNKVEFVPFGLFESFKGFVKPVKTEIENSILFFGHINKYKGVDILISAFKLVSLKFPQSKLFIVGKVGKDYKQKLFESKMKNVFFRDELLSNTLLVEFIQKSSVVVCPYISGSQSGIPMLSFFLNKPMIATDVGAFSELIENDINGYIIQSKKPVELSNTIIRLFENPDILPLFKNNIKNFVDKKPDYNWANITKKTINFYNQTIL